MTVRFIGWYGRRNTGDEAFKEVHRRLFPDENIVWLQEDAAVITDHAPGDVFVLGSGEVFQPHFIKRIPPAAKFFIYGAALGRDFAGAVPELKGRLLGAWMRNRYDVETLKAMGVEAQYTPDVTFQLRYAANERQLPEELESERKKLIFIPSNGPYQAAQRTRDIGRTFYNLYLRQELAARLDSLAQYYDLFFLPFSFDPNEDDRAFIGDVYSLMQQRRAVTIVDEEMNPLDAARFIGSAQLVLSMHFHGAVFSTMMGTPFVSAAVTRDTTRFCEENEISNLMWAPSPRDDDDFLRIVKGAEDPATRKRLAELSGRLVQQATEAAGKSREAVLAVHEWSD
jgi:polysaccharide pyruvyl transferase WcaK-like protein